MVDLKPSLLVWSNGRVIWFYDPETDIHISVDLTILETPGHRLPKKVYIPIKDFLLKLEPIVSRLRG